VRQSKQAATPHQHGSSDPVLQLMEKYGIEKTRENYLEVAFMGEVPEEIGAEIEEGFPDGIRLENG